METLFALNNCDRKNFHVEKQYYNRKYSTKIVDIFPSLLNDFDRKANLRKAKTLAI